MQHVRLSLEGDGCWPELKDKMPPQGVLTHVAYLPGGMTSGNPSIMLRGKLEDGTEVLIETSARMFVTLAAGVKGRCIRDGVDV